MGRKYKDKRRKRDDDDDDDDRKDRRKRWNREFGDVKPPSSPGWTIADNVVKLAATGIICATTVALFTLQLFGRLSEQALSLPTLAFGALSTAAVWFFGKKGGRQQLRDEKARDDEIRKLQDIIDELEDRIENVEAIETLNERLIAEKADKLARSQMGSIAAPTPSSDDTTISSDGTIRMDVE